MNNTKTTKAVKCGNGTFVGKQTDELIIWKGIPYATQPVGKLRWKKALPAADGDTYMYFVRKPVTTPPPKNTSGRSSPGRI